MRTLIARHTVSDSTQFLEGYKGSEAKEVRDRHGVQDDAVYIGAEDASQVIVLHRFNDGAQASAFLQDPDLGRVMAALGVTGQASIGFIEEA